MAGCSSLLLSIRFQSRLWTLKRALLYIYIYILVLAIISELFHRDETLDRRSTRYGSRSREIIKIVLLPRFLLFPKQLVAQSRNDRFAVFQSFNRRACQPFWVIEFGIIRRLLRATALSDHRGGYYRSAVFVSWQTKGTSAWLGCCMIYETGLFQLSGNVGWEIVAIAINKEASR